jgi:hypothetical protein
MSQERNPSSPVAAYKEIIDRLASETSHGVSERLVVEQGKFGIAQNDETFNSFVQSLSFEHRRLLAKMLHAERISAIGDVLAVLEWWVMARDVGFTFRGQPMPVRFAEGLLGEYIGRLDDWQWPTENNSTSR